MSKRECKVDPSKTKSGNPCGANPLRPGTEIEGVFVTGDYCRRHDPLLPASARFGTSEQASEAGRQGGRPKTPRVVDVLKERIEQEVEEWLDVLKDARNALKVVGVIGEGEMAEPIEVEDHAIRLKALSIALDRTYGKPRQEITGADGQPLQMEVTGAAILNDADARKHAAGLRSRVGTSRTEQPRRTRARH